MKREIPLEDRIQLLKILYPDLYMDILLTYSDCKLGWDECLKVANLPKYYNTTYLMGIEFCEPYNLEKDTRKFIKSSMKKWFDENEIKDV